MEEEHEQQNLFDNQYLKFIFSLLECKSKMAQSCAISCLSRVIINCPDDILVESLDSITDKIIQLLKMKTFQHKHALIESLITIIFHIEDEF